MRALGRFWGFRNFLFASCVSLLKLVLVSATFLLQSSSTNVSWKKNALSVWLYAFRGFVRIVGSLVGSRLPRTNTNPESEFSAFGHVNYALL